MQITLSQPEIEAAIRAYVNERTSVSSDAAITLTDNGAEGFTASVDLGDETKPLGIAEKATRRPRQPREPKADQPKDTPAADETKPEAVEQTPAGDDTPAATAQEAAGEASADSATTEAADSSAAADGAAESPAVDAEAEADPATAEPPPEGEKPRSLFGNLGRPKNP